MASAAPLRPALVLAILGGMAVVMALLFMTVGARGSWDFVLPFRGRKLWGLVLVAGAVAVSTVLFQTISGNRILTPSIIGFDSLYELIQTSFVFLLGSLAFATIDPQLRFGIDVAAMVLLATLLFRWLFGGTARSLHLLVLVGIVLGLMFRSLSGLMQRMIDPNAFTLLQDSLFASFNAIDPSLLVLATIVIAAASLVVVRLLPQLDVLTLGRDNAIGLGVDHVRTVSLVLALIAVLVSVSTALVGPVLFFGLLVANLAYVVMPSHRHALVLPTAVLLGVIGLVGGQLVLERVFGMDTALSITIEFVGGITFLILLLRSVRK